jgi:outer membrane protein OmpA-like peptidoglycan-associated protein
MQVDGVDEKGAELKLNIERRVLPSDLANARLQILGFHTSDPAAIDGSTSLGPSLAVVRDLRTTGSTNYSIRNFRALTTYAGTLTRAGAPVPFPVLINGRRVELPALRASGEIRSEEGGRPWEEYVLDHPQHPLTLRIAVGRLGDATVGDAPVFAREIVRIDFPTEDDALEEALTKECKAEVSGIYFDFDRATLNPESSRALQAIADVLRRQPDWRIAVGGHTDNVGTDTYNLDLSARRAAAVKAALVGDYKIDTRRMTTAGFGAKQPVETNDTIAGRARNRRVELVRDCR